MLVPFPGPIVLSHCAVPLCCGSYCCVSQGGQTGQIFHTLSLFPVKMGTNQSYLFLLLLASLSASCTSDCPTLDPNSEPPYHKCAKLYSMLETALLANPENLYQLQEKFFPSSSLEPIYAGVTFRLNEHSYSTCWTSSVLLKSVDPSVLSYLQIELLNLLTVDSAPGLFPRFYFSAELFFNLTVNSNLSDYSNYTINPVLQELATWVSVLECWINYST